MFEINLLLPHLFAPMSRSAKVSADHQERPDLIKLGANGKTVLQGTEIQIWLGEGIFSLLGDYYCILSVSSKTPGGLVIQLNISGIFVI